jgi:thioredoxin 1
MVSPIVEELAREYDGKIKVMKLNTDENMDIAIQYNILSIPTLGFFKGGQMVDRIIGAVPKKVIVDKINKVFQSN